MPNTPPARVKPTCGCPSAVLGASRYAAPRQMNAIHTIANSELKASVDLRVKSQRRKVKMNQAKIWLWLALVWGEFRWSVWATNVERKCRVKVESRSAVGFFDLEASWDQDDGQAYPETTVRR